MPDLSKTVEILFNGVDNISDVASSIDSNLSNIGTGMQDFGAPFISAAETIAGLEAAILGISAAVIKARGDLESESAKMSNALGLPIEKVEEFEDVALRVYNSGFAGELTDAFGAVTLAAQKFKDESAEGLENIVNNANTLNTVFGVDVSDSLSAVNTLMSNFGLSSEEAFDFITTGFQEGLNGSGDFLESINEYATQFKNGGATAGEFFSVMSSGYQEGVLGTDKAADAFKEFVVRIQDGSKTTAESLEMLGLDQSFVDSISNGETTAVEAFETIIRKLNETDDASVVMQAGVGLIGTQFEDLGASAALSLSTTVKSLDDMEGKIASIDPSEQLGVKFQAAINTIKTTILSDDVWDSITSNLGEKFDEIKENFVVAWDNLSDEDFNKLLESFEKVKDSVIGLFADADIDLTSAEGITQVIQELFDTVGSINTVFSGLTDAFSPVVAGIAELVRWFNDLDEDTQAGIGNIVALGTAFAGLGTVLATGGAVLAGIGALGAALTGPVGVVVGLGAVASAAVTASAALGGFASRSITGDLDSQTEALNKQSDAVESILDKLNDLPVSAQTVEIDVAIENGDFEAANRLINEAVEKQHQIDVQAKVEQDELNELWTSLVDKKNTEIQVTASTKKATEEIEYFVDGKRYTIDIPVDTKSIDEAKKSIEDVPTEKQIEIKLQGDIDKEIARIEATAQTAQAAFKYTAEVDIAKAEAAANVLKAQFDSLGESTSSLAGSVSDMFGALVSGMSSGELSQLEEWSLQRLLEDQQDVQNALIKSQTDLATLQAEYMRRKLDAVQNGDIVINITSDGLEPALEMVIWEMIKKVQVRVNEEAADFLFAIS